MPFGERLAELIEGAKGQTGEFQSKERELQQKIYIQELTATTLERVGSSGLAEVLGQFEESVGTEPEVNFQQKYNGVGFCYLMGVGGNGWDWVDRYYVVVVASDGGNSVGVFGEYQELDCRLDPQEVLQENDKRKILEAMAQAAGNPFKTTDHFA